MICPFRIQHQGTAGQGDLFEALHNYTENKNEENENKIILENFNCFMDKMDSNGENKHKDFIDAVPIIPGQSSLQIIGLRIYGEERIQIPLGSPAKVGPLARIQDRQSLKLLTIPRLIT